MMSIARRLMAEMRHSKAKRSLLLLLYASPAALMRLTYVAGIECYLTGD